MPKSLYKYSGDSSRFDVDTFYQASRKEANLGDLRIASEGNAVFELARSSVSPLIIMKFVSRDFTSLVYRKTARAIRESVSDFYILRFILRGTARIGNSSENTHVGSDAFSISRADAPYYCRTLADSAGFHEAFQIYIPAFMIAPWFSAPCETIAFTTSESDGTLVRGLADLLFLYGENLKEAPRMALIRSLLSAIEAVIPDEGQHQLSAEGERANSILEYIRNNATNPKVNADDVAFHCKLSKRSMNNILRKSSLTFIGVLTNRRIEIAKGLLEGGSYHRSIGEIAALSGFRSISYFSAAFRAATGKSPSKYRNLERNEPAEERLLTSAYY